MLFELGRRYSPLFLSLLISLIFLIEASCTINPLPAQVNPPNATPAVTGNVTASAPLDINSFSAQPKTIKPGENTVISWKVAGASSLSIEPDIGNVTGTTGSISTVPRGTTLYTLTASDASSNMIARFLVIVKTAEGKIIWSDNVSDNTTVEQPLYEGWIYYPNKYVEWNISDKYKEPYSESGNCWQVGSIINKSQWTMTEVSVDRKVVADFMLPSTQRSYSVSVDCLQLPELRWKWKDNK